MSCIYNIRYPYTIGLRINFCIWFAVKQQSERVSRHSVSIPPFTYWVNLSIGRDNTKVSTSTTFKWLLLINRPQLWYEENYLTFHFGAWSVHAQPEPFSLENYKFILELIKEKSQNLSSRLSFRRENVMFSASNLSCMSNGTLLSFLWIKLAVYKRILLSEPVSS